MVLQVLAASETLIHCKAMSNWEGIEDPIVEAEMDRLAAKCDANSRRWIEEHRDDPCEVCGMYAGVEIIPSVNLARLTPLC